MSISCCVCGEWVASPGHDRLDICEGCWPNFAGAQPPLDWAAPREGTAREALEAYVDAPGQLTPSQEEALEDYALALNNRQLSLTPRQVNAMRRSLERWQAGRGEH